MTVDKRIGLVGVLLTLFAVWTCGGGGGGSSSSTGVTDGSGRPPFASSPTCSSVDVSNTQAFRVGNGDPNVWVPETSIERPSDVGKRAHTNVLVYVGKRVSGIAGYTPSQIATAYGVNQGGVGAIAVVDAYNDPTALNDFNVFANQFGLPTESSSVATSSSNSVFQVVYATGNKPGDNAGWAQESAVDIEWAHSMAPQAKIYLVETASSLMSDIMYGVKIAKALPGVREVSTSFGIGESACSFVNYDSYLVQNGVTFFASAGDSPGVRDYPAESMNAVAVGGTSLQTLEDGTYVSESVWDSTGCGPSAFEPRPVFQDVFYSKIGLFRGACDICAVADPNTGVAIYDSTPYQGTSGWAEVGGTSVSCPVVAGIVNSAGTVYDSSQALNTVLYGAAGSSVFHPVTKGSSGGFKAGTPWSFPTGLGSPNGLASLLTGN